MFYKKIDYATAKPAIVSGHYSHTCRPSSWAFGAYEADVLVGVLLIAKTVKSSTTNEGVCGPDRADDVFELSRLWMSDDLPRTVVDRHGKTHSASVESKFIGWCLRALAKERPNIIVVSYADTVAMDKKTKVVHRNQNGVIYQASNGIYTGTTSPLDKPILDWQFPSDYERGRDYRDTPKECRGALVKQCECGRSLTKMLKQDSMACECGYVWSEGVGGGKRPWVCSVPDCRWHTPGERALKYPRSPKHRYVWFGNPDDRKLLRWPTLPYPKKAERLK